MMKDSTIAETSTEFAKRLRRQDSRRGLASRFDDFKERCAELVEEGLSKTDADRQARLEFLPEPLQGVLDEVTEEGRQRQARGEALMVDVSPGEQAFSPAADIVWVYHNVMVRNVDTTTAPSTGALLLLKAAQRDEFFFLQHVWGPAVKNMGLNHTRDLYDDGTRQIEWLDNLDRMLSSGNGEL